MALRQIPVIKLSLTHFGLATIGVDRLTSCTWKTECQNHDYVRGELAVQYQVKENTQLYDLERSRPIALLKDAKAETLTEWLKAHPGVKVVSRDRSKTYESGIRGWRARSH